MATLALVSLSLAAVVLVAGLCVASACWGVWGAVWFYLGGGHEAFAKVLAAVIAGVIESAHSAFGGDSR